MAKESSIPEYATYFNLSTFTQIAALLLIVPKSLSILLSAMSPILKHIQTIKNTTP